MKLNDILGSCTKREFMDCYRKCYPHTNDHVLHKIARVFEELEFLEESESEFKLKIATISSDTRTEYMVYGYIDEDVYGDMNVECEDWNSWLGSECMVDRAVCSALEFAVHCVNEMTFFGYTPEEVQKKREEMKADPEF